MHGCRRREEENYAANTSYNVNTKTSHHCIDIILILSSDKMAPKNVRKQARRRKQRSLKEDGAERPCVKDPNEEPQCISEQGRRRKRGCSPRRAPQHERGRANTHQPSRAERVDNRNERRALLAEIASNESTLERVGAELEWHLAEQACWQAKVEEKLKLREMLRSLQPGAINE